jgi:hypothetical protein
MNEPAPNTFLEYLESLEKTLIEELLEMGWTAEQIERGINEAEDRGAP